MPGAITDFSGPMSVADLLRTPRGRAEVADWTFNNAQDHALIVDAIRQQRGVSLRTYTLDPLDPDDLPRWLYDHQTMHADMDAVLGIQSVDLSVLDPSKPLELTAWIFDNYIE